MTNKRGSDKLKVSAQAGKRPHFTVYTGFILSALEALERNRTSYNHGVRGKVV